MKHNPTNAKILDAAMSIGGVREIKGPKNAACIMRMYEVAGARWVKSEDVPWCSAAACYVASLAGVHNPKTLRAREWLKVPKRHAQHITDVAKLQPGDFVILSRGNSVQTGHIGVFCYRDRGQVVLQGGNQRNAMCVRPYSATRFLLGLRMKPLDIAEKISRPAADAAA